MFETLHARSIPRADDSRARTWAGLDHPLHCPLIRRQKHSQKRQGRLLYSDDHLIPCVTSYTFQGVSATEECARLALHFPFNQVQLYFTALHMITPANYILYGIKKSSPDRTWGELELKFHSFATSLNFSPLQHSICNLPPCISPQAPKPLDDAISIPITHLLTHLEFPLHFLDIYLNPNNCLL